MKELLLKIFNNSITSNAVISLIVGFLGWAKDKHDVKVKNKEIGYWMMKYKILHTFLDAVMKIYKWLIINCVFVSIIRWRMCLWKGILFSYVVSGILYLSINALIIILSCNNAKVKVEFWSNKKCKLALVISLYLIYVIPFIIDLCGKYVQIVEMVFVISLIIWHFFLYGCCDIVYILDNRYADIYVKGSEKAQFTEVGSIKKQGEWIIVNRHVNERDEEIRIRQSDIVRIDYYGGPKILIEKQWLFKTRIIDPL